MKIVIVFLKKKSYYKIVRCCEKTGFKTIYIFCGNIFYEHSFCCVKNGLKEDFMEYLLDGFYTCNSN